MSRKYRSRSSDEVSLQRMKGLIRQSANPSPTQSLQSLALLPLHLY